MTDQLQILDSLLDDARAFRPDLITDLVGATEVPSEFSFAVPTLVELEQEGLPYFFHEIEWLGSINWEEAGTEIAADIVATLAVAWATSSYLDFELVAEEVSAGIASGSELEGELARLSAVVSEEEPKFGGLDMGIAGLVYALSAAGYLTVASCRGHGPGIGWSEVPVVYFAATSAQFEVLAPQVDMFGGTVTVDDEHPDLLCLALPSCLHAQQLALVLVRQFLPDVS